MPLVLVEGIPPSITHTLVSVVVSHRIMQMTEDPASDQLVKPMWNRLYRHRDIAVREIAQLVASEKKRKSRVTLVAVYTLFFAMVRNKFFALISRHPAPSLTISSFNTNSSSNPSRHAGGPTSTPS